MNQFHQFAVGDRVLVVGQPLFEGLCSQEVGEVVRIEGPPIRQRVYVAFPGAKEPQGFYPRSLILAHEAEMSQARLEDPEQLLDLDSARFRV